MPRRGAHFIGRTVPVVVVNQENSSNPLPGLRRELENGLIQHHNKRKSGCRGLQLEKRVLQNVSTKVMLLQDMCTAVRYADLTRIIEA